MELIVISSPSPILNEAKLINKLFESGLGIFHLRKPDMDLKSYAELIEQVNSDFRNRIAIHQHHELERELGLKRVHYPEQLRLMSNRLSDHAINTTSVHNPDDLKDLMGFDYCFLSPVFDSISKSGYRGLISSDVAVKESEYKWLSQSNTNVVALGGVDLKNISVLKDLGFTAAAVLGALWNEPANAVLKYQQMKAYAA